MRNVKKCSEHAVGSRESRAARGEGEQRRMREEKQSRTDGKRKKESERGRERGRENKRESRRATRRGNGANAECTLT